ncbi:MAG TPA: DUF1015 domain-containing protein, partial [Sedimentisphaerales bacterium]|nr:DUF1015 domain-containing protein [Sedimentisphaerales bacterium]
IRPFCAYRFDETVVGDAGGCIAPPYDVIDAEQRSRLYARNPYNIVRIDFGKTTPDDTTENNQYTRAAGYLRAWLKEGALKRSGAEMLYAYVQDFRAGCREYQRAGFVGLGELQEFGKGVRPHERTLDGPRADRLNLLRATGAQFGQVFMLYDDPKRVADAAIRRTMTGAAMVDAVDDDGVRHRLFGIEDKGDIGAVCEMMADRQVIIADGHHRYETAVNYWRETGNPNAGWSMMTFVNMHDPGLLILPTHRLVGGLGSFDMKSLLRRLKKDFEVAEFEYDVGEKDLARREMFGWMKDEFVDRRNAFGIYAGEGAFYTAVLRNPAAMDAVQGRSSAWRMLDVSVLHKLILEDMLGIGEKELANESHIEYIKDIGDAIDRSIEAVDSGKKQAVFFMNPTRIDEVRAVAEGGERMPQKSTFFHPKVYTGLTINIIAAKSD